jgi:hypothetical protein
MEVAAPIAQLICDTCVEAKQNIVLAEIVAQIFEWVYLRVFSPAIVVLQFEPVFHDYEVFA